MSKQKFLLSFIVIPLLAFVSPGNTLAKETKGIIHDAEHYILEAQHGEKWAVEDKAIDQKLADLEKKHGTKPNIIHIMWDDTALGEVGIPEIQAVRGFETPVMNKMAEDGINFMRMYTEPACTPTREIGRASCRERV